MISAYYVTSCDACGKNSQPNTSGTSKGFHTLGYSVNGIEDYEVQVRATICDECFNKSGLVGIGRNVRTKRHPANPPIIKPKRAKKGVR